MREVSDRIPKVDFIISKGFEYNPDIYYQFPPEPDPDLKKTKSIKVRRGEYLGRVGRSGLGQFFPNLKGEIDEFETPTKYNPYSWDSSHLHLEVYRRNEKGIKIPTERWDPFGWYGTVDRELRYGKFEQSNNGLFVTGKKQQIKFAKG